MNKIWCWTCDRESSERFRFGTHMMLECGHIQPSCSHYEDHVEYQTSGRVVPKYVIRIIGSMSQFRVNALNEGLNVENNSIKIFEWDTIERLKRRIDWFVNEQSDARWNDFSAKQGIKIEKVPEVFSASEIVSLD